MPREVFRVMLTMDCDALRAVQIANDLEAYLKFNHIPALASGSGNITVQKWVKDNLWQDEIKWSVSTVPVIEPAEGVN